MEDPGYPKQNFITQVVTVVHTCHSHNIAASRKKLGIALTEFRSQCRFEGVSDELLSDIVDDIGRRLSPLRYTDSGDGATVTRIKSECMLSVSKLGELVEAMALRDETASQEPAEPMSVWRKLAG